MESSLENLPPRDAGTQTNPLALPQQRLWFLHQFDPQSAGHNLSRGLLVSGSVNVDAMEKAIRAIMARHRVLGTVFPSREGKPVPVVTETGSLGFTQMDLRAHTADERQRDTERLLREEAQRPFDLARGPLLRALLLRLAQEEYALLVTAHEIVFDEESADILFQELGVFYDAFCAGQPLPSGTLPVQYWDVILAQCDPAHETISEDDLGYWKEKLRGSLPLLELPADRPRPPVRTASGARQIFALSSELVEGLKRFSQDAGVTLFTTLLAAFAVLLHRYTQQEDILIGSPLTGRTRPETAHLIGRFERTLVLRTDLSHQPSFTMLLRHASEVLSEALAHQNILFEQLLETLQPDRSLSHTPLFQAMFALWPRRAEVRMRGLTAQRFDVHNGSAKVDLALSLLETSGGLQGEIEYSLDLFEASRIARMAVHYETLLRNILADPQQAIYALPFMPEWERRQLLEEWNQTVRTYPTDQPLHELVEAQVARTPESIAVIFENDRLTYGELDRRANQLAHHLLRQGVAPEVRVGLFVERSLDMVIALLGILKAGGAYVPLDPMYPKPRLAFMIEDSGVPVLLTQERLLGKLPEHRARVICLDRDWPRIAKEKTDDAQGGVTGENLAYVIYTSGSTGQPKGVMVPHRGVTNVLWSMREQPGVSARDVLPAITTLSFDIAALELFLPLLVGATVVVLSREVASDGRRLLAAMTDTGATILQGTPATWRLLLEAGWHEREGLRMLCGGEALSRDLAVVLLERGTQLWNLYGPTESSIYSTACEVSAADTTVPIGRPIANTEIYLLDRHLQPVPVGVPGEIYIGGAGLARGYLNRPDLTAKRFIPHPFSVEPGARLYKTGDQARYRSDGQIEYLGRLDHQVKVRGFRIEPEEIELALKAHPGVREVVVAAREHAPGDKRLVAFVVPRETDVPPRTLPQTLRRFLLEKVPEYMVPSAFVLVERLPLTPSGKVDRQALPWPEQRRPPLINAFVKPQDSLQYELAEIWEGLLGVAPVGIRDSFFELGGDSLLAVRMMYRIEEILGKKLPLATLFAGATIEHLAKAILQHKDVDFQSSLVSIQTGGAQRPFFFLHGDLNGGGFYCARLARALGPDQPFYALQPHGLDGNQVPAAIEAMAASHLETLQAFQPQGPYLLGGHCNGGLVAFEMARRLKKQGHKVDLLIVMAASAVNRRFRFLRRVTAALGKGLRLTSGQELECFLTLRSWILRNLPRLERFSQLRASEKWRLLVKKTRRGIQRVTGSLSLRGQGADSSGSPNASQSIEDLWDHRQWEIMQSYEKAMAAYIPSPYEGRVTVFWPREEPAECVGDPTMGWHHVAREVEVHLLPGGHLTSITKYIEVVGERLKSCLLKAEKLAILTLIQLCPDLGMDLCFLECLI